MIPLEDTAADIIGKAQRGLGISDTELAKRAAVLPKDVRLARAGNATASVLEKISPVLELDAEALKNLASGVYPPWLGEVDGLAMFNTPFDDITVNSFFVWEPGSRAAVAFDSGADCTAMLEKIEFERLKVEMIFLTHAHADHVADLERLIAATRAPVYTSEREEAAGANTIGEGREFNVADLHIKPLLTWGHSPGGMSYFITGLAKPIAIVGDSIFAGSMGGGNISYADAVENNLRKILTLPNETVICPGHGPLTTVGTEKAHNPFFAAKFRK